MLMKEYFITFEGLKKGPPLCPPRSANLDAEDLRGGQDGQGKLRQAHFTRSYCDDLLIKCKATGSM